jgi:hypothetical protein
MDNSEMLEVAFVEQTMQSTQGCEGFAMLKSGVTFNEDAKCLGHFTNKTDVGVTEIVLEADEV